MHRRKGEDCRIRYSSGIVHKHNFAPSNTGSHADGLTVAQKEEVRKIVQSALDTGSA